jgi:hypothetical protein
MDILVRLALASGYPNFFVLSRRSAQHVADTLPPFRWEKQSPNSRPTSFDAQPKAAAPLFSSALHNAGGPMISIRKKRLAVSRWKGSSFTLSPLFGWLCILGSRGTEGAPCQF